MIVREDTKISIPDRAPCANARCRSIRYSTPRVDLAIVAGYTR